MEGDHIRLIPLVLIVMLLSPMCVSAGSGLGVADALADGVKNGIDKFFITVADRMYETSYRPSGTYTGGNNTSASEIMIYATTTHTMDPFANTEINKFRRKSLLLVVVYAVVYGAIGLLYVFVSVVVPSAASAIDAVLNRGSDLRSTRIKHYFHNLATSLLVVGFTDIAIQMLFTLNLFFVSFLIVSSMETHTLAPTADNVILYFFMGVFYTVLTWFMCMRDLMLYIFVGISYIIGGLLISNKTRSIGMSGLWYYSGVLFMQSIIVLFTTLGFMGGKAICSGSGTIVGSISEIVIYLALLFILLFVAFGCLFGMLKYKKAAITAVKLVV